MSLRRFKHSSAKWRHPNRFKSVEIFRFHRGQMSLPLRRNKMSLELNERQIKHFVWLSDVTAKTIFEYFCHRSLDWFAWNEKGVELSVRLFCVRLCRTQFIYFGKRPTAQPIRRIDSGSKYNFWKSNCIWVDNTMNDKVNLQGQWKQYCWVDTRQQRERWIECARKCKDSDATTVLLITGFCGRRFYGSISDTQAACPKIRLRYLRLLSVECMTRTATWAWDTIPFHSFVNCASSKNTKLIFVQWYSESRWIAFRARVKPREGEDAAMPQKPNMIFFQFISHPSARRFKHKFCFVSTVRSTKLNIGVLAFACEQLAVLHCVLSVCIVLCTCRLVNCCYTHTHTRHQRPTSRAFEFIRGTCCRHSPKRHIHMRTLNPFVAFFGCSTMCHCAELYNSEWDNSQMIWRRWCRYRTAVDHAHDRRSYTTFQRNRCIATRTSNDTQRTRLEEMGTFVFSFSVLSMLRVELNVVRRLPVSVQMSKEIL